jgi:hypothetical protein
MFEVKQQQKQKRLAKIQKEKPHKSEFCPLSEF